MSAALSGEEDDSNMQDLSPQQQQCNMSAYARLLAYESYSFYSHLHPSPQDADKGQAEGDDDGRDDDNDHSQHWTNEQLAKLWPALSRNSRLRPDVIAAQIGKTTAQVCELLSLLESQSYKNRALWKPMQQAAFYDSLEAARQVSDEWLAIEEKQSTRLERNEAALLVRLATHGQTSSSSPSSHPLDAIRAATPILSPVSWQDQVHCVVLFLRHSLTSAFHGNFESLGITQVPIYSLQVADESLCSSTAYLQYARTHPVPPWPRDEATAKEALKQFWSEAERCGYFVSVESVSHRYGGTQTRQCKLRPKLGGGSKLHFVWTDEITSFLPGPSLPEPLGPLREDFAAPEKMSKKEIMQRASSAKFHLAQARTKAKLRVLASLNAAELQALGLSQRESRRNGRTAPAIREDSPVLYAELEDELEQEPSDENVHDQGSDQQEPPQKEQQEDEEEAANRARKKRKIATVKEQVSGSIARWESIGIDKAQLTMEADALAAVAGEVLNVGGLGKLISAQQDDKFPDADQPRGISAPTLSHLVSHLKLFIHPIISHLANRHTKPLTAREINDALMTLAPPLSTCLPGGKTFAPHQAWRLESARMSNLRADPPVDWRIVSQPDAGTKTLVAGLNPDNAASDHLALHAAFQVPDSAASIIARQPTLPSAPPPLSGSNSKSTALAEEDELEIASNFSSLYEDSEEEAAAMSAKQRIAHLAHGVTPSGLGSASASGAAAWKERRERRRDERTDEEKWRRIELRDEEKDVTFEEMEWRRWTRSTEPRRSEKTALRGLRKPIEVQVEEVEEDQSVEDSSAFRRRNSSRSNASTSDNEGSLASASS